MPHLEEPNHLCHGVFDIAVSDLMEELCVRHDADLTRLGLWWLGPWDIRSRRDWHGRLLLYPFDRVEESSVSLSNILAAAATIARNLDGRAPRLKEVNHMCHVDASIESVIDDEPRNAAEWLTYHVACRIVVLCV